MLHPFALIENEVILRFKVIDAIVRSLFEQELVVRSLFGCVGETDS